MWKPLIPLSMVLIPVSNDQHHNYIIALLMEEWTCRVLWAARDKSLLSPWWHRSYIQQVWSIHATYCKGSSFPRRPQVVCTSGLVSAHLFSKQWRWQRAKGEPHCRTPSQMWRWTVLSVVSNFFMNSQDAVKSEDHWLLFTQKILITAVVPVHYPNILKQTRFILEWEFGKTVCFTQSGQGP